MNSPDWIVADFRVDLGYLPGFLSLDDPSSAKEQLDKNYGWHRFEGHTFDPLEKTLKYPGDPDTHMVAFAMLREETIALFEHDWVMILQKDGSYEIARMD